DGQNDIYIAGDTFGSLGGDNAGLADAYVAKYDPAGNLVWVKQLGKSKSEVAKSITLDDSDDIYIAGQTDSDWDGPSSGESDAFVAKLDADGNMLWAKLMGSDLLDYATGISAGSNGIYITGMTAGNLDGENRGGLDAFIAKYNVAGQRLWVRQIGGSGD